jgi:cytochrome c biogenesis protein CcmG/thiol:disulfide interchange protein DsbE
MNLNPVRLRFPLIFTVCLGLAFLLSQCAKEEKGPSLAPEFSLKTLTGEEMSLAKNKGKILLIDFWATWCGPCREAIPHLVHLHKTYRGQGLEVVGLSMDKGDPKTVDHFVESLDIPYPIAIAPEEIARAYGVNGLPTTVLIDKEGQIREKIVGFNTAIAKKIESRVVELISEKPR